MTNATANPPSAKANGNRISAVEAQRILQMALLSGIIMDPNATETPADVVTFERTGTKVIMPEGMTYEDLIKWARRRMEEENQVVTVTEKIPGFALDGLAAFMRVLARRYGWTEAVPTPGFFGPTPPQMISVETGLGQTMQLPMGRILIPNIEGHFQTNLTRAGAVVGLVIQAEIKGKHKALVEDLFAEVKKSAVTESIYKGKAIKTDLGNNERAPRFMDLAGVNPDDLILPRDVDAALTTSLFTPIRHSAQCRTWGIPLKRGVLLSGPYGTGKTLSANVTAKHCQDNGWTFVYLESVTQLKSALEIARYYQPCVLFAEDLDRALSGQRDENMDSILNTLDGVDTKGVEVITVFTTNNVLGINPAMLRPGRLDAVVEVKAPDADAAERLLKRYSRGLAAPDADFKEAASLVAGFVPASIREAVERAKLAAIHRGSRQIEGSDMTQAALALKNQNDLFNRPDDAPSNAEVLEGALNNIAIEAAMHVRCDDDELADGCGNAKCPVHGGSA